MSHSRLLSGLWCRKATNIAAKPAERHMSLLLPEKAPRSVLPGGAGDFDEGVGYGLGLGDHEVVAGVDVPPAPGLAGLAHQVFVAGGEGGGADDVVLREGVECRLVGELERLLEALPGSAGEARFSPGEVVGA